MQTERRRNPYPWTWEPLVLGLMAALFVVLLMVHTSRAAANWLAGGGWTWPASRELAPSTLAVLGGDATAGLSPTPAEHAGETLLTVLVVAGQLAWVIAAVWVVAAWWYRAGPGRIAGLATARQAREVLGRRRLRAEAAVIRPDLYGKKKVQR